MRRGCEMRRHYERPVCWVVLSPSYETHSGGWYEPPEYGRDFLYAFCRSAQRAKVLALRAWRRHWWHGCHEGRTITPSAPYVVCYDDENPMVALTVERVRL
jgi:hypothetical protein